MSSEVDGPVRRVPRAEVRRRLVASAAQEFAEHGYVASKLERIAFAAGFTKGAVYSNFGSKQALFAAVLQSRADDERERVFIESGDEAAGLAGRVGRVIADEITSDSQRGRLGLEFAAQATRDPAVMEAWTPLRRAHREAAKTAVVEVAARSGLEPTVDPSVAALILHCVTNGLSMEHLADPEEVDEEAIETAVTVVISALTRPQRVADR